ncbi:type III-B CRISPR-associated protein Cas10/Cmr2 [Methanothrix soehngenii]|uniref:type III-B CRISPR-associated protein Cas10/Cmr2 n=1 Tax=Methanothrix soehngenii TaxID=2223 RepID=UPI00300CE02F
MSYNDGTDAGEGSIYLGYGLIEANGELNRRCLGYPIEDGALELSFLPSTPEDNIKSVEAALLAMGFFGGLGSRSRKGYGSFNLKKLTRGDETDPVFISPSDKDGLKRAILNLFDPDGRYKILRYDGLPPYTAFSKMMRIDILDTSDEPLRLLNSIGDKMMEYRSYRKEKNFLDDYKLIRDALAGNVIYNHPKRSIFGLPHNYYFSSTKESAKVKPKDHERRASPLFIHIQRMNESQFAAITAIIPADFLPHGEKIMVGDSPVDADVNGYKVLHEFIDGRDTPRFASLVRVIERHSEDPFYHRPSTGFRGPSPKTRDLWSGSFLLSYLAGCAIKCIQDKGGEIEIPDVREDRLLDWIKKPRDKKDNPIIGSLPNRFEASAPNPAIAAGDAAIAVSSAGGR